MTHANACRGTGKASKRASPAISPRTAGPGTSDATWGCSICQLTKRVSSLRLPSLNCPMTRTGWELRRGMSMTDGSIRMPTRRASCRDLVSSTATCTVAVTPCATPVTVACPSPFAWRLPSALTATTSGWLDVHEIIDCALKRMFSRYTRSASSRAELQNLFIKSTSAVSIGQVNAEMCSVHGWPLLAGGGADLYRR